MNYGFQYFCGANVVVAVEDLPLLEATGLQYEISESKMPIYGYSSRHYDAVARGQVIVRGTLIINYVHQDYLFRAIRRGLGQVDAAEIQQPLLSGEQADLNALVSDYEQAAQFISSMKQQYWAQTEQGPPARRTHLTRNPHDLYGGVDITVAFGPQSALRPAGVTGVLLRDVHFTSRGSVITMDEQVIGEAYQFFARDVFSTRNPYVEANVTAVTDEVEVISTLESY